MNPIPVDELPLLELFTRLREAGLPLGMNEYQLVLRSLQAGFGIQNREALAKLCRTLWIKSPEEERLFNHHFEQIIGHPTSTKSMVDSSSTRKLPSNQKSSRPSAELWVKKILSQIDRAEFRIIRVATFSASFLFIFFVSWHYLSTPIGSSLKRLIPSSTQNSTVLSPIPTKSAAQPPAALATQNPFAYVGFSYILVITPTLIIIGVVFWRVSQRIQRIQSNQTAANRSTIAATNLSTELIQQIGDEVRVARVVRQRLGGDGEMGDRILTNPEFFPITRRQMKQRWRYLRRFVREGLPTEVDIDATIRRVGQQGLLLEPVLVPGRINRTELILLIDQDGSMVPFHSLSQRLIETAVQGGRLGNASVYYFHNCPTDYVYHDPVHQEAVAIDDFLAQLNPRTAVLIFSDAGSARGGLNSRRRRVTKTFIDDLKQHVRYVAWLNPMPRSRWAGTTAGDIANLTPMFEMSRQGLDGAIDVLRGRYK